MLREKQQIIILVIATVVIGSFVLFRYKPLHGEIHDIKQVRSTQLLTIAKGISDSKQLPLVMEQIKILDLQLQNFEARIPKKGTTGQFIRKITELMDRNDLEEKQITPRQEIKSEYLNCIPINMQCKGSMEQIFDFYRQLQNLERLVRIQNVRLNNDEEFSGRVNMDTELVIYYKADVING